MLCKRCSSPLVGKQTVYCSKRCCKLYLKSLYRKRNRERINEYNRKRDSKGVRTDGNKLKKRYIHLRKNECSKCGSTEDLQVHHIKPRICGGTNESNNLILFCRKCHYDYENLTKRFWFSKRYVLETTIVVK